jgi:hypothetical protein
MYGSMLAHCPLQTEAFEPKLQNLSQNGNLVEAEDAAGGAKAGQHEAHVLCSIVCVCVCVCVFERARERV